MKFILISLVSFFVAYSSFADEVTTLDDLVKVTLEKNPEIRASVSRWKASTKRPSQEGTLPNPTVGIKFRNSGFDEITLGDDPMSNFEVSFNQEIPFPGKLSKRQKISEYESEAQRWDTEGVKRDVIAELKKTYYEWYLVNRSIEITRENKDLLEKFTRIAETKYEVGKGIQQDVVKAQVELSKFIEKLELLNRRKGIIEARLRTIANMDENTALGNPVSKIRKTELSNELVQIIKTAKENSPGIRSDKEMIERNEQALVLARKNYFPDLILHAAYANRSGGNGDLNDIWELGIGFRVPLYFWSREKPAVEEATINLVSSKQDYTDSFNKVVYMLNDYYLTAESTGKLTNLYSKGIIPQSKLSLESALSGYQVGKVDFLTLLDSLITLYTYRIEYYNQLVEHQQALADIERITGTSIIQ